MKACEFYYIYMNYMKSDNKMITMIEVNYKNEQYDLELWKNNTLSNCVILKVLMMAKAKINLDGDCITVDYL